MEEKKESFFKKHKSQILKVLFALLIVILISFAFAGILLLTGVLKFDPKGLAFNTELFNAVKGEWWFVIVWIVIQVVVTILLCFVPGSSMMFIIGSVALFKDIMQPWQIFLISFGGVILSSIGMDLVGRFGGSRLATKLVGKEDYEKAEKLIETKGMVYVPVMYLLPVFPDDAICMCCGVIKMKFWLHVLYIVLCRGIGCATIVFGLNLVPFEEFHGPYEWAIFITFVLFWMIVLFFITNKIDKWLTKFLAKKREEKAKKDEENKQIN